MQIALQTGLKRKEKIPFLKEIIRNKNLYIMMFPGILFLFIFSYIPMYGITVAFKDTSATTNLFGGIWVGFKNFEFFFTSQDAFRVTFNTVFMNSIFICTGLFTSVVFALLLNEIKIRFLAKLYQSIMFIPYFLSWVVVGFLSFAFLSGDYGFINNILKMIGIEPIQWYSEPKYWPFILTIVALWKNTGLSSIIYLAGITGISEEYYEAAKIDGATRFQQMTKITIPLITPLISIMTLLAIGRIFYADFGLFYYLPRETGVLFSTTDVIDTYVFRTLRTLGNIGMASAAGVYQSVVGFILILTSNLFVKRRNPENALF